MTLDEARDWANRDDRILGVLHPDAQAAIEVIQSLPDKWVDAEKLEELLEGKEGRPPATAFPELLRDLRNLITPKLPTLAQLIQSGKDRNDYLMMQARFSGSDCDHVIIRIWRGRAALLRKDDGLTFDANQTDITPLPDLPKLEWPSGGDAPTIAQKERVADDQAVAKDVCNRESNRQVKLDSSPQPEPKVDEVWIVEEEQGGRGVGRFAGEEVEFPWFILLDEGTYDSYKMGSVTPICRMVPESPALPEGMRLADSEEYGRIIVSPRTDLHGDYLVGHSDDNSEYGADWTYLNAGEFTYLDGETK